MLKERDLTVGQISDAFAMTTPSISYHLDLLKHAQLVSARTGLSQQESEQRVNDVINQAKAAADEARKAAAKLAFWFAAALLAGGLSACLAAVEGGRLRDGLEGD